MPFLCAFPKEGLPSLASFVKFLEATDVWSLMYTSCEITFFLLNCNDMRSKIVIVIVTNIN